MKLEGEGKKRVVSWGDLTWAALCPSTVKQPCAVVAGLLQPPSAQCGRHRAASEKPRVRPRAQHPGTVSDSQGCPVHSGTSVPVPSPCIVYLAPSPPNCWCSPHLTGLLLACTHAHPAEDVVFGLPGFSSPLPCSVVVHSGPVLHALVDLSLFFLKPKQPPSPHYRPLRLRCSAAQRSAVHPVPSTIHTPTSTLPPTPPADSSFLPAKIPSLRCRPAVVALTNFSRFFSSRFSPPALSPPAAHLSRGTFPPLVRATDPSFSANGGKTSVQDLATVTVVLRIPHNTTPWPPTRLQRHMVEFAAQNDS